MNGTLYLWLIPLLPFAGFLLNGILGSRLPKWLVTTIALVTPLAAFGVVLNAARSVFGVAASLPYVETCPIPWINAGTLHVDFSFVLDQLSLVMLLVITGVGFLIHIYSVGYMGDEEGYARYFSFLNLFLFFMTVLVLAGNALLMFVGWEGVGLASYLLIGFYFKKDSAANAGKKAFIVNRIGDFGFLIGMFLLLANFGTLTFSEIATKLGQDPGMARRRGHGDCAVPAAGRDGQERAVAALYLAAGCDGRPDAGFGADSRGDDGDGGRLHDCARRMCCLTIRHLRWAWWRLWVRRRRCLRRLSGWCRTTSSGCWPTRRFRSLGTCFWGAESRLIRRPSST